MDPVGAVLMAAPEPIEMLAAAFGSDGNSRPFPYGLLKPRSDGG